MKVNDIMTASVDSIQSTETIAAAARRMADDDVGVLPVLDGRKLIGIVTDRDIAVRAVAACIDPQSSIRRIMTEDVVTCSPEADLEDALQIMSNDQVRRLPVCDRRGEVVGIIALADAAHRDTDKSEVAEALEEICEPSGLHCQAPIFA